MKLIYLPTNRKLKIYESMAKQLLQNHPEAYIRAELPEHWRVEGYDKSWEWAQTDVAKHYDVTSYRKLCSASISFEGVEVISRAEFEYHIYNPWKEKQSKFEPIHVVDKWTNRIQIGKPYTSCIETNETKKSECEVTKQPHYNQQPIEVIDMMLAVYGKEAVKNFCLLNSFKYRMRAGHKDDALQDIEKAKWYEAKAKEIDATPTT